MKTPKNYTANIKNRIITGEMLSECLFSVNKRAKNCRDQERKYRSRRYDKYDAEESYRAKKDEYYRQKDKLLSILQPVEIHMENQGFERIRVYDYEPEYEEHMHEFVYENSFWDSEEEERIYFGDYYDESSPLIRYYLYYELENHSFHSPIDETDLQKYQSLSVKDIGQLVTFGKEYTDLISTQFVKKVLALIEEGDYVLQIA